MIDKFKKVYTKNFSIRILLLLSVVSFIFNSCINKSLVFYIQKFNNELVYKDSMNSTFTIEESDTITTDTLILSLNFEISNLTKGMYCQKYVPNPIGSLMSYSFGHTWCYQEIAAIITSNNTYNGIPPGNSLNSYFLVSGKIPLNDYLLGMIQYDDSDFYRSISLVAHMKPNIPNQKFTIKITTDKGVIETETVNFYWY